MRSEMGAFLMTSLHQADNWRFRCRGQRLAVDAMDAVMFRGGQLLLCARHEGDL